MQFGVVEAGVDYRIEERTGNPVLECSYDGFAGTDRICGGSWADVSGKTMNGHVYIHLGDDSSFVARRR